MSIFCGRASVRHIMQTQVLRFCKDTAKVSSLPLLKITTKSTHFLPAKKSHRSSHPDVFLGKSVLNICCKFTGERPCQSLISINLQRIIEIALRHVCSHVNLLHIFRTSFPRNTSGWLLLKITMLWIELQTNEIQQVSKPYI